MMRLNVDNETRLFMHAGNETVLQGKEKELVEPLT
jgi:hypothetical protein